MKKYQYQILRYMHDQFTGEFVNLGVVVYCPGEKFLKAQVSQKYSRVTSIFPKANGKFILRSAKQFAVALNEYAKHLFDSDLEMLDLSKITKSILPHDDSALMLTKSNSALDISMDSALHDLFLNMVDKYNLDPHAIQSLSDNDVWKKKYKDYFDQYNITKRLSKHKITTEQDSFVFDKSWKNEIWHCYQPISFDLQDADSIKEKVYKWSGKLRELNTSSEKIHLTFLTTMSEAHKNLNDFISKSLDQDSEKVDVDVVLEQDANQIAQKISKLMAIHDRN